MKALFVSGTTFICIFLSGCMNYVKPPLAVTRDSYTKLQEKEKTLIPAGLKLLTLDEAQKIAIANNPDFKSIQFTIDAARARYYQGYSSYAPTLNAGMSISQTFSRMHSSSNGIKTRSQSESYRPTLSGQLLIFDCLAREMNLLASKYELAGTKATVDDAKRLLLRAVAYAYNDVLLAQTQKKIILAKIEYSRKMLQDSENKYNAGSVLLSDVLNFRITLDNGRLELVQAEYNIKVNKYILAGYLGLIDGTIPAAVQFPEVKMPKDKQILSVTMYIDQALANRPDLKAYRERLQAAKYSYWGTWSAFGPTVTGNYSLDYNQSRSITHGGGGSHNSSGTGAFGYGINAEWNLFNGFYDYYNVKAALASVAETDWALAQTWISVITDVRSAYENYLTSFQQAKMSKEICELTKKTRGLVENEYNAGTALVTRLNEAERDLVEAQNNLASSIVNIENAKAQLEAAVYAPQTLSADEAEK